MTTEHCFFPPTVLYEDKDLLVLSKPAGIPSVNLKKDSSAITVANWLISYHKEFKNIRSHKDQEEGGLCHRLDRETSGVMVAAKNATAYAHIREQFSDHKVKKLYLALVEGELSSQSLRLVHYLGGRHRSSKKVSVFTMERKRTSRAELDVTQRESFLHGDTSFVTVNLHTGFRHQIRAQLAAFGHPLIGDKLYGSTRALPAELNREFFLHAYSLTLQHPLSGKQMTFEDQVEPLVSSAKGLL